MTTAIADDAALLLAIRSDPADGLPRLAYADWCDENGEHERAEFVRVQIELAGIGEMKMGCLCGRGLGIILGPECKTCRYERLSRREDELMRLTWCDPPPGYTVSGNRVRPRYAWAGMPLANFHDPDHKGWDFSRGFVSTLRCPLAAFMADDWRVARELFALHPITAVTLTDREPYYSAPQFNDSGGPHFMPHFIWFDARPEGSRSHVGKELFAWIDGGFRRNEHVAEFTSRELAIDAISRACVRLGRVLAGLPRLAHD